MSLPGAHVQPPGPRGMISCCSLKSRRRSIAGDEHVLPAIVGERLAGKAAVHRLHLKARDVDEREPFILSCPPE